MDIINFPSLPSFVKNIAGEPGVVTCTEIANQLFSQKKYRNSIDFCVDLSEKLNTSGYPELRDLVSRWKNGLQEITSSIGEVRINYVN